MQMLMVVLRLSLQLHTVIHLKMVIYATTQHTSNTCSNYGAESAFNSDAYLICWLHLHLLSLL